MVEVIVSILALMLILLLAWGGTLFGVFYELTSSLLLFLAMMVTMRYWYEATRLVESVMPGAGAYGAFGAYWALFLVGSAVDPGAQPGHPTGRTPVPADC